MKTWTALLLAAACGSGSSTAPPPAGGGGGHMTSGTTLDAKDLLHTPPWPSGEGIPPEFDRCRPVFERAAADYDAGAYAQAADGFLRAASILTIAQGRAYGDIAGLARSAIYEDAAHAWRMAGTVDSGLARLDRIEHDGVATNDDLASARATLRERH